MMTFVHFGATLHSTNVTHWCDDYERNSTQSRAKFLDLLNNRELSHSAGIASTEVKGTLF